jgi:hypothetical protein
MRERASRRLLTNVRTVLRPRFGFARIPLLAAGGGDMTNEGQFWLLTGISVVVAILGALLQVFAADKDTTHRKRLTRIALLALGCLSAIAILAAIYKPGISNGGGNQLPPPVTTWTQLANEDSTGSNTQVSAQPQASTAGNSAGGSGDAVEPIAASPTTDSGPRPAPRILAPQNPAGLGFIRLVRGSVAIYPKCSNCMYSGFLYVATPKLRVENSGPDMVYAVVLAQSLSIGNCSGDQFNTRGLTAIQHTSTFDPQTFSLIRPHSTVDLTTNLSEDCLATVMDSSKTDVSLVLLVSDGARVAMLPLTLTEVSVSVRRVE